MAEARIQLLVPGLLQPPAEVLVGNAPRLPALEQVLADARELPAQQGYAQQLFSLLQLPADQGIAPFMLLADGEDPGEAVWMRASPVHLRADLANLMLFDAAQLAIEPAEAQGLIEAFNEHFADRSLSLVAPHPQRWYLRVQRLPQMITHPVEQVVGRSPEPFMPEGPDAAEWRGLLTEIQMLLHAHPLNRARQGRGLNPINGLWLDGAGQRPKIPTPTLPIQALLADDLLGRGLARWLALPPKGRDEPPRAGDCALFTALQCEPHHWQQGLSELDEYLQRVMGWVKAEKHRFLELYDCAGRCFHFTGGRGRRLWRRRRPLRAYLSL